MMNHEHYMRLTFDLALLGLGHTSPHPLVGALLVRDDKIIGTGYYKKYGSSHAEVNAIQDAKEKGEGLVGATLYCNLEPGPCAQLIVEEKISRVVICNADPNPKNSGIEILKSHGIDVVIGIESVEGLILNEVYFKFAQTNMPFVHVLQKADSVDGLRQKYDCVVVSRKTIELDDPSLINSSTEFEKISHPLRIVVGKLSGLSREWTILNDEMKRNTMIVATDEEVRNNPEIVQFLDSKGVALLSVKKNTEGLVDLKSLLKSLAGLKLTSILVEGEPTLATEFINCKLVDK